MTSLALVLLLLAPVEQPQNAPQQKAPQQPPRAARAGLTDAELTSRLDAYAIEQAQKALELTKSQYTAFAPRLRRFQEIRRRNIQARNKILQQLRQLTTKGRGAPVDEAAIRTALKSLHEQDDRAAAEEKRAYAELDEVLDVRQQARLRLFEQALERRKMDLLMRVRSGGRGRGR